MKPTGAEKPTEQESAEIPSQQLPRRSRRWWLLLGIPAIVAAAIAVAVAIVFRNPPPAGMADPVKLPGHFGSASSEETARRPIIPLEVLFPEESAGRSGAGPGQSGAEQAGAAPGSAHEPAVPIPTTPEAVVAESAGLAEELTRRFPGNADALEITARMHLWLGDSEKAARAWESCLAIDPRYAYAHEGLGILAAKRGEYDDAISHYRKALEAAPNSPSLAETRILLATVLIDQGRLQEAIDLLGPDGRSAPVSTEALVLLGTAHLQSRDYAEAKRDYEAAIASQPTHANAHFGLATACRRLGETEEAARIMEQFQKLRSAERAARVDQRSQYDDVGQMRERLAQSYTNAARICRSRDQLSEAERYCRRAAALDPKAVDCRQAVAWFCQRDGRTREAISTLRELGEIEKDNPAYLLEIGRLAAGIGEVDEAERAYQQVCDAFPDSADGFASLAKLCLKTGRRPQQVESLANLAASLESSVENCLLLAAACERSGNMAGAVAAMDRVMKLDANRSDYRRMHQELMERLNRPHKP